MTNSDIIKSIANSTESMKKGIQRLACKHAEAQCNGDYYYNDDTNDWTSTTGKNAEAKLLRELKYICGTKKLPDFISYSNDPRGIVVKIEADKLTDAEKQLCRDLRLYMDWGGDYSILTNAEFKALYDYNN